MNLFKQLKEAFDDKCREAAIAWPSLVAEKGAQIVYWMAALFVISPVIDAENFQSRWEQFKQLMSGLGIESLGNLIQDLRNKKKEDERVRLLQTTAENSSELKEAFDSLLEKIDGLQILLQTFNEHHKDSKELKWFQEILEQTLHANKSRLKIKVDRSAVAKGKKSSATSGDYSPSLGSGKQEIHYHLQTPSVQPTPNFVIEDLGVESPLWEPNHYMVFTLSNLGGGIVFVDRILLRVLKAVPSDLLNAPCEGAILKMFNFEVNLFPNCSEYILTDQFFVYKSGDIDGFKVKIMSDYHYTYDFQIEVEWHTINNTQRQKLISKIHTITFRTKNLKNSKEFLEQKLGRN